MMKSLGVCLGCTVMIAQSALSQQKRTDRERDGFLGEVYAVRATLTYLRQGSPTTDGHKTSYYDKEGNLALELTYEFGRMVTKKMFQHNGPDEVVEKIEDGGWDPSVDLVGPNPPLTRVINHSLKFDGHGNMIEESLFSEDGALLEKTEFRRDHQGRLLEKTVKSVKPYPRESKTTFTYHEGNEPTSSTYEPFPKRFVTDSYDYEFDAKKNWIKRRTEGSASDIERTITYYSSDASDSAQAERGLPLQGESPADPIQRRPAPAHPFVIRKSKGVLGSEAIRRVLPVYPMEAKSAHITGQVDVEVHIGHSGDVVAATALSGPRELQNAALEAAKQWKFRPTALSGMLVDVIGVITFNFQM